MSHTTLLRQIGLPLAFALAVGCGRSTHEPAPHKQDTAPGLVLITIDGLSAERIGVFGGSVATPALEGLAREGAAWADGWTTCPMTRPAVATYLTGLTPDRHGVRDDRITALPEGMPTLASRLAAKGYRTAAFPDSSFLSSASGLLAGFEVVDDPPEVPSQGLSWLPLTKNPAKRAENFRDWLGSLPKDQRFFAWLHFSRPLVAQVAGRSTSAEEDAAPAESAADGAPSPGDGLEESLIAIDRAVATVLAAIDARGSNAPGSAVVVAGTSADAGMAGDGLPGPGLSLDERAIRVPFLARIPGTLRPKDQSVWAPDVAVTLAALGGVELPGSEGRDLREAIDPERISLCWTWGPRDLMGWRALRAARSGNLKRIEGLDAPIIHLGGSVVETDSEGSLRLARSLAERAVPNPPAISLDSIRPLLTEHGLRLDPVPANGRDFGPAGLRREAALSFWKGQALDRYGKFPAAEQAYERVLEIDRDNLGALLTLGQVRALQGTEEGRTLMRRVVARYPDQPEVLHWYAHAVWADSWREAETLLRAIQPLLPHEGDILYDLACASSLDEDLEEAEKMLRASFEAGYRPWSHIESDPDLRNLRASGRFARVLQDYR